MADEKEGTSLFAPLNLSQAERDRIAKRKRKKQRKHDPDHMEKYRFREQEIVFLAHRAAGHTIAESFAATGSTSTDPKILDTSGRNMLNNIKRKLSNNEHIQQLLGMHGADLEDIARVIGGAMKAEQPVVIRNESYVEEKETGKQKRVSSSEVRLYPDHRARLMGAELATKIHDAFPVKKIEIKKSSFEAKVHIIQQIKDDPQKGIAIIQRLIAEKSGE